MIDDDEFIAKYEARHLSKEESKRKLFSDSFGDDGLFDLLDSIEKSSGKDSGETPSSQPDAKVSEPGPAKPSKKPKISGNKATAAKPPESKSSEPPSANWSICKPKVIAQLNRLSDSNLSVIIQELYKIISSLKYDSDSIPNDMISDLVFLISKSSILNTQTQPSIIAAYSGVVTWLYSIYPQIGYAFVANLYDLFKENLGKLNDKSGDLTETKSILSSLVNFSLLDVELLYDVIAMISDSEMSDELSFVIITLFRYCYHIIHSNSPETINQIKSQIQVKIGKYKLNCSDYSKSSVRFLELELLENKKRSDILPLDNVKESIKRHYTNLTFISKNSLYNFIKSPNRFDNPLKALKHVSTEYSHLPSTGSAETTTLLAKASSLGLSNSVQKSVFLILMRSHDFNHAFKLITDSYSSKNEIPSVLKAIVTCLISEKEFNAFYVKLIELLSKFGNKAWNKSFKYTLRCTLHNYLSNTDKLSKRKRKILKTAIDNMINMSIVEDIGID